LSQQYQKQNQHYTSPPHLSYINDSSNRRNSFSSSSVVVEQLTTPNNGNGNLYRKLGDEARSLLTTTTTGNNDDLIDLGQDDGRNVLETFDPLFDKSPPQPLQLPKEETSSSSPPMLIHPSRITGQQSPKTITEITTKLPSPPRDVHNISQETETDQIPSSNYGWKSDISLYPSLPPAASYDTFQSRVSSESGDPSILYDAYNQFEYLYQVSISSETSSFYWHPSDVSPGGPPSPSRPSEYVSAQTVRMEKARRRSSDNNVRFIFHI
jgi:hypothetical protein